MESQDIITYKQNIVKVIDNEETVEILKDGNLWPVLKILQKGPMTINDLVETFEKKGDKKSDKTIYRYLHTLVQAQLVAKAGKRITSITADELISETIYIRTAKAFIFPEALKHTPENYAKGFCPVFDASRLLLKPLINNKKLDSESFQKLLFKLDRERDELLVKLFNNADDETIRKINDLDWKMLEIFLNYSSWIAISTKIDIKKELENCII
ncbi:MAG: hypothetical protein FK731_03130 [Asgard group archaeon]|nr:hypothetical protein [Asgard group archaeon]